MLYRWLVKFAHRFDWHHAPVYGPQQDGRYQRWCHWCGLRQSYTYDPRKPIPGPLVTQRLDCEVRMAAAKPEELKSKPEDMRNCSNPYDDAQQRFGLLHFGSEVPGQ
jgi:hypothetical protein